LSLAHLHCCCGVVDRGGSCWCCDGGTIGAVSKAVAAATAGAAKGAAGQVLWSTSCVHLRTIPTE
jgi:hypothetical protein